MSGPATPAAIRHRPCVACGSTDAIRWEYGGQVYCHDGIACGRRMLVRLSPHPYRSPASARNDRCLDCGEYEEDGPHTAA
jgi:hypothetical protein